MCARVCLGRRHEQNPDYNTALDGTWTYTQALYFAIVTMSTTGYGDLSPDLGNTLVRLLTHLLLRHVAC